VIHHRREERGFTLVEVLVAMLLLAGTLSALASLIVLAVRVAAGAREQTMTAVLAAQKIEELRSTLAGTVPTSGGSLDTSLPGYGDWLDGTGQSAASATAVYVRRWAVGPLPAASDVAVVQVLVSTVPRDRIVASGGGPRSRHTNEALLVTFTGRR
jgi:type II secretory pathway pseudopilin PulG